MHAGYNLQNSGTYITFGRNQLFLSTHLASRKQSNTPHFRVLQQK